MVFCYFYKQQLFLEHQNFVYLFKESFQSKSNKPVFFKLQYKRHLF